MLVYKSTLMNLNKASVICVFNENKIKIESY